MKKNEKKKAADAVAAPPAPASSSSSSKSGGAAGRTFLVTCPVAVTTEVRPLSAKSLRPLSSSPADARREVSFVAWSYGDAPSADKAAGACDGGQKVDLVVGAFFRFRFFFFVSAAAVFFFLLLFREGDKSFFFLLLSHSLFFLLLSFLTRTLSRLPPPPKKQNITGEPLSVPGSSGASFVRTADAINVTLAGGAAGSLPLPKPSSPSSSVDVSACLSGSLVTITAVSKDSPGESVQLLFNKDTSCLGANALSVASIQGATSAERTADAAVAARAGVPLPKGYKPPPAPPAQAPLANPCLAQEEGYSTGLATTFFSPAAEAGAEEGGTTPAKSGGGGDSLLAAVGVDLGDNAIDSNKSFSTFKRCDCPNQRTTAATPWPGTPALPESFVGSGSSSSSSSASGFGARMTGQVAIARPAAGVAGEGPELFPTASDYHLVCLQHDDAASLSIDGTPVYESAWTTTGGGSSSPSVSAGFKQYCAPLLLSPGWHDVDVRYAHASRGGASVLRLFVLDAAAVNSVDVAGTPSYEIVWEGQGKCCTGGGGGSNNKNSTAAAAATSPNSPLSLAAAAPPPCAAPVDCCRFRSKGKCNSSSSNNNNVALPAPTPRPTANKNETITKPRALPPAAETTPTPTPTTPVPTTPAPTPDSCDALAKITVSAPKIDVVEAPSAATEDAFFFAPRANVSIEVVVSSSSSENNNNDDDDDVFATAELSLRGTAKLRSANADAKSAPISLDCSPSPSPSSSSDPANKGQKTFVCRADGIALPDAFECSSAPLDVDVDVAATLANGKSCPSARASLPPLEACRPPLCRFYAVDMGYCGSEGLVTDRGRALVVMACSQVREKSLNIF